MELGDQVLLHKSMDLVNTDLKIKKSPIHGWGIFANEFIEKDIIIIQTPGIVLESIHLYPKNLVSYFYPYGKDFILGLGHASLINSNNKPNSRFEINTEDNIITIIATRDIFINEEITLKYL